MNLAPTFLDRVRKDSPATADELLLMHDAISTGWNIEHNPDGTHKTVHAYGPISERGTVPMGTTIPIFFSPTNFVGVGGMTVTVIAANVANLCYALVGTRMILDIDLLNISIGGVLSNSLTMLLPDGYYAKRRHVAVCSLVDNGAFILGLLYVLPNTNTLVIIRSDVTNFNASAANTQVQGQIIIEVGTS